MMSIYRKKSSLTRALRLLLAFFIVPPVMAFPFFIVGFIVGTVGFAMGVGALIYGFFISVFLGFPAYMIMRWKRIVDIGSYVLAAAIFGSVPPILSSVPEFLTEYRIDVFYSVLPICVLFSGFSSIGGLLFWLIARPDLT